MANYFALKVTGGRESFVADAVRSTLAKNNIEHLVEDMLIPKTKVATVTSAGNRKISERNVLCGYIILKAEINHDLCGLINTVDGVYGFLGSKGHPKPIPQSEVSQFLASIEKASEVIEQEESARFDIAVGDQVEITDGIFNSFSGVVDDVDNEKKRVKVSVMVFGGSNGLTIVDLSFNQVKKKV